jgi:hypothetical protein
MAVIISNDALSKLRQEVRRRRLATEFRELSRLRRPTTAPRPTYDAMKPQIKMIGVSASTWNSQPMRSKGDIAMHSDPM